MEDRFISVLCYFNGKVVSNAQGVSYDRMPSTITRVLFGVGFEEFEGTIRNALQISHGRRINMIYRYPLVYAVGTVNYISFPISNDESLRHIFVMLQDLPPPNNMEIYVDVIDELPTQGRAANLLRNEHYVVRNAPRSSEDIGPSPLSPIAPVTRLHDDHRDSGDDADNDYDDGYHRESSADSEGDSDNDEAAEKYNHVHFGHTLMTMIEHDGSMNQPALSDDVYFGLSMEDNESQDTPLYPQSDTPQHTMSGFDVPSPSFMELNLRALTPMSDEHNNVSLGWNEVQPHPQPPVEPPDERPLQHYTRRYLRRTKRRHWPPCGIE